MNLFFFYGALAFLGFHVLTFSLVKFATIRFSFFNVAQVIYSPFLDVLFTAIMFRLSRGFFCAFLVR